MAKTKTQRQIGAYGGRGSDGRFVRGFDRITLYAIVKDVAAAAARRLGLDPLELTTREWSSGRRHVRHVWPDVPQAHEVCRQLPDHDGNPIEWRELLRAAFEEKDIARYDAARLRHPERPCTRELARHGLRRVAFTHQVSTLDPLFYEEGCEWLLFLAAQHSPEEEAALRELLPTSNQILTCYEGDWDAALADANLGPRPKNRLDERPGVSVPIAIALYFAGLGGLPTSPYQLRKFAKIRFSLETIRGNWDEVLERGRREIEALHLPEPPPVGQRLANHQPIPVNLGDLPPPRKGYYTKVELIEWGQRYRAWLGARSPGLRTWRSFGRAHPPAPSYQAFAVHDGLKAVLEQGTRRGWRKRAETWDAERRNERSKTRGHALRQNRAPNGRPVGERLKQIRSVLRKRGPCSLRELGAELGLSAERVRVLMRQLEDEGTVERTEADPKSPKQRYRLCRARC